MNSLKNTHLWGADGKYAIRPHIYPSTFLRYKTLVAGRVIINILIDNTCWSGRTTPWRYKSRTCKQSCVIQVLYLWGTVLRMCVLSEARLVCEDPIAVWKPTNKPGDSWGHVGQCVVTVRWIPGSRIRRMQTRLILSVWIRNYDMLNWKKYNFTRSLPPFASVHILSTPCYQHSSNSLS
jgi:hypothetical protein